MGRSAIPPLATRCCRPRRLRCFVGWRNFFPELPDETAYAWTGTFGETSDSLPYIGVDPENPRVNLSLGYRGNGIIFSILAAGIIRDHFHGWANAAADLFRFERN